MGPTVNDIIKEYNDSLSAVYDGGELLQIIFLAFEHVCSFKKTDLVLNSAQPLAGEQLQQLRAILDRLKTHEPIQYILGYTVFDGLKINVNRQVLIPRQETEELVHLVALQAHPLASSRREGEMHTFLNVLDLCTGSGCIAIALKKRIPDAAVTAVDISAEAIAVAKENAKLNEVDVNFIQADIFLLPSSVFPLQFDLIVSNPPYVLKSQAQEMHPRTTAFEPHLALFVEYDDALVFYKRIADIALQILKPGGKLYFEINELKGQEVCAMLEAKGFKDVTLKKDLNGKDRMVYCHT